MLKLTATVLGRRKEYSLHMSIKYLPARIFGLLLFKEISDLCFSHETSTRTLYFSRRETFDDEPSSIFNFTA